MGIEWCGKSYSHHCSRKSNKVHEFLLDMPNNICTLYILSFGITTHSCGPCASELAYNTWLFVWLNFTAIPKDHFHKLHDSLPLRVVVVHTDTTPKKTHAHFKSISLFNWGFCHFEFDRFQLQITIQKFTFKCGNTECGETKTQLKTKKKKREKKRSHHANAQLFPQFKIYPIRRTGNFWLICW